MMEFVGIAVHAYCVTKALDFAGLDPRKRPAQWLACVVILAIGTIFYKEFTR